MTLGAVCLIAATLRGSSIICSINDSTDAPKILSGSLRASPSGINVSGRAFVGMDVVDAEVAPGVTVVESGGLMSGGTMVRVGVVQAASTTSANNGPTKEFRDFVQHLRFRFYSRAAR